MPRSIHSLNRRDFLKLAGVSAASLALNPFRYRAHFLPEFPVADRLARNATGGMIPIKSAPDSTSSTIRDTYEDTVLEWLREVPGYNQAHYEPQRYVETPEGYVFSGDVQMCRNQPNTPLSAIPDGKPGFWAEVTVPYVDFTLENAEPISPGLRHLVGSGLPTRLYYSQVMWIDQVSTNSSGQVIYRVNEDVGHGYGYGDIYWAEGAAFRPLTDADVAPIHPEVDPNIKKVVVNLSYQTLSCMEGDREVYFCRVSTGVGDNSTPVGEHITWRKAISIHMAGGTVDEGGWDTPGVSWTTLFSGTGVAVHAAYWHNQFGEKRSHGCVNCKPEDAKWIFRWTTPSVSLDESDKEAKYPDGGTHVVVEERLY